MANSQLVSPTDESVELSPELLEESAARGSVSRFDSGHMARTKASLMRLHLQTKLACGPAAFRATRNLLQSHRDCGTVTAHKSLGMIHD